MIEPDEVYPNPVSGWDALEKLPDNARDIIWSLVYRKLKAGRGCSPVTPKESEKLIKLIRENNREQIRDANNLTWRDGKIISISGRRKQYDMSQATQIIIDDIVFANRRVETYLQAYFTENAGNPNLDNSVFAEICGKSDEIITDSLWLIGSRDKSGAHTAELHGNFIPQIPHQAMLRYTKRGEIVLDTFSGNGTTLIECKRLGRNRNGKL